MRILIVTPWFRSDVNGVARSQDRIIPMLAALSHSVTILVVRPGAHCGLNELENSRQIPLARCALFLFPIAIEVSAGDDFAVLHLNIIGQQVERHDPRGLGQVRLGKA